MVDKPLWEVKPVILLLKEEKYRPASTSSILRLRHVLPLLTIMDSQCDISD